MQIARPQPSACCGSIDKVATPTSNHLTNLPAPATNLPTCGMHKIVLHAVCALPLTVGQTRECASVGVCVRVYVCVCVKFSFNFIGIRLSIKRVKDGSCHASKTAFSICASLLPQAATFTCHTPSSPPGQTQANVASASIRPQFAHDFWANSLPGAFHFAFDAWQILIANLIFDFLFIPLIANDKGPLIGSHIITFTICLAFLLPGNERYNTITPFACSSFQLLLCIPTTPRVQRK